MHAHCRSQRPLLIVLVAIGCVGDTESTELSYQEYTTEVGSDWFDPVGASAIDYRCHSTRDGYDAWWRFTISEKDGDRLVADTAANNNGPTDLAWSQMGNSPATWQPAIVSPKWWPQSTAGEGKSIHWCHDAGSAERHHGWYFCFDPARRVMYCWHWNHQWSSAKCESTHSL